jgi:hypothetical protein
MAFNTPQTKDQISTHRHADPSNLKLQAYPAVPSPANWKADSFVGTMFLPRRADDKALLWIDRLVEALSQTPSGGESIYLMAELFFATLWWLNGFKDNPKMDARRRPAVLRLNLCAANEAAAIWQCTVGEVARELKQFYGTEMAAHGIRTDIEQRPRYLSSRAREESCRVFLRCGLAHKMQRVNGKFEDTLLDTSDVETDREKREGILYVMSVSGALYASRAGSRTEFPVDYHSSFMGGQAILCGGTMSFKKGRITMINNKSGHYQPVDTALAQVLRKLLFAGVKIADISVEFADKMDGKPIRASVRGDKFLNANGNVALLKSNWVSKQGEDLKHSTLLDLGHAA